MATMKRVHNFGAGPAALPLGVLEQVQAELLDYGGTGMSVMEISHRSPAFGEIASTGIILLAIPAAYAVLEDWKRSRSRPGESPAPPASIGPAAPVRLDEAVREAQRA